MYFHKERVVTCDILLSSRKNKAKRVSVILVEGLVSCLISVGYLLNYSNV